jgi:ATP-dependent DNA helicase RecG
MYQTTRNQLYHVPNNSSAALVHRDCLVSAPIRLSIFDNRIEIVNPGHLPNNLTVEKIKAGNSNIRNPILVSYVAKGMLPYHGLGSGITRALDEWPEIDFTDDRDGCLFKAIVHRKEADSIVLPKVSGKTSGKILEAILQNNTITIPELSILIGITERSIERNLQKLQKEGILKRIGPAKGGHWLIS